MIYVITQNNEIIFTSHIRETFENYIDGLCVKHKIDGSRFDEKVKSLNLHNIHYYTLSITFEEE